MKQFTCQRCGALVCASLLYVQRNWPVRCSKCGATHHSSGEVISPEMLPVDARSNCAYSPWQLHSTRPTAPGLYECRFRELDDPLCLWFNGRYFQPTQSDDRVVQMATFLSWRGRWAE
jgi:hypothetical protein